MKTTNDELPLCNKCGIYAINRDPDKYHCDICYYREPLLNLLAVIHGDGGQYVNKHGLKKAVEDAKEILADGLNDYWKLMKTIKDEEYSFRHVQSRLKERHNLKIDRPFYDRMNESIKVYVGKPDCGFDNNGTQEIHTQFIMNKIVKVVYCNVRGRITTVLL